MARNASDKVIILFTGHPTGATGAAGAAGATGAVSTSGAPGEVGTAGAVDIAGAIGRAGAIDVTGALDILNAFGTAAALETAGLVGTIGVTGVAGGESVATTIVGPEASSAVVADAIASLRVLDRWASFAATSIPAGGDSLRRTSGGAWIAVQVVFKRKRGSPASRSAWGFSPFQTTSGVAALAIVLPGAVVPGRRCCSAPRSSLRSVGGEVATVMVSLVIVGDDSLLL